MNPRGHGYTKSVDQLIKDAFFEGYKLAIIDEEYKRLKSTGIHNPESSFKYSETAYICQDVVRNNSNFPDTMSS